MNGWATIDKADFTVAHSGELTLAGPEDEVVRLYAVDGDHINVPRSWAKDSGLPYASVRDDSRETDRLPRIVLRPYQDPAVDAMEEALKYGGGILCAACGTGKTVMGLELARRFQRPAVVIVHKTFLMNQWAKRIATFLPEAKVGFWQGKRCDSGADHDFVIAMVQSLTGKRHYPQKVYDSFGMVISDEAHRLGAPTWQSAIVKFSADYRLGLTATPYRKDGMHKVFMAHIGGIKYELTAPPGPPAKVHVVRLQTEYKRSSYEASWMPEGKERNRATLARLTSKLAKDKDRTAKVCSIIAEGATTGRKFLVLTDRLDMIKEMQATLKDTTDRTVSKFIGGMSENAQDAATEADIILATYQMAKEALDIPALDTLVLATPKTDMEQAIGRIVRFYEGKAPPLVIDLVDHRIPICSSMANVRRRQYGLIESVEGS